MPIPDRCMDVTSRKLIKVSENGRSFILKNSKKRQICLTRVDDCAITVGERCDFMYASKDGKELFVELKGSDIKKALSQVTRSIGLLSKANNKFDRSVAIVSSRVPSEDTGTMNAKAILMKSYVSRLYIKNVVLEIEADLVL